MYRLSPLTPDSLNRDDRSGEPEEARRVVSRRDPYVPAMRKVERRTTDEGLSLHSFRTLLRDLATLTRNQVRLGAARFQQLSKPTPLQPRAFQLLGVRP